MKKEEFQQNMKDRMQQFEDGGLRLLKKGQKGIVHAIFSRFGLVLVLLLLQVGLLFSIFRWFGNLLPHYFGGSVVVTSAMVIYLLNSKMDNSAKITWMVTIAILPVVGVPLFFYVKSNAGHNLLRKRLMELENTLRPQLPQNREVVERLRRTEPGAASLANYLHGPGGGFPVYENTAMTYFPSGEAKFAELLRQLETAEHYIFLEYFIIHAAGEGIQRFIGKCSLDGGNDTLHRRCIHAAIQILNILDLKGDTGIQGSVYQPTCGLFITQFHSYFGDFSRGAIGGEGGKPSNLCTRRPVIELFVIFIPSHFRTSHSDYRISQTKVAVSLTSMSSGSMSISAMAPIGIAKHFSSSIYSVRETTLSSPQL